MSITPLKNIIVNVITHMELKHFNGITGTSKLYMTKMFYMGKRINSPWQVFKAKVKYTIKVLIWVFILSGVVVGIFEAGRYINPPVIYTKQEVIKEVKEFPAILKKIAQAESWNSHYCTQKLVEGHLCKQGALGQVLVNSTLDVGRYAINLNYNGKWCADKGYNIFDEKQNEQCALELFYARGSEPWNASKSNWNK